ncbi:MAG: ABC transporter substrate-binding protein [Chloroflexi bacterium]|nr:ABC transporter substrate-binding protein [Chloroflexota bacterium]
MSQTVWIYNKKIRSVVCLFVLLALVVGCAATATPAPAPAQPAAAATKPPVAAQPAQPTKAAEPAKPAAAATNNQLLRMVTQSPVQFLRPWAEGGDTNRHWMADVYIPPFNRNEDGSLSPGFALSVESSPDELEWTLKLDPKAVFSNGKPLTAKAIKVAWEYGATAEMAASFGGHLNIIGNVVGMRDINAGKATEASGLTAKDDQTLVMKLDKPTPGFKNGLGSYLLGAFDVEQAKADPDKWMLKPAASGPYQVQWFRDDNKLELTPNLKWWRDPAKIQKIVINIVIDGQTRLIAYENNEVDIMKDTGILGQQLIEKFPKEMIPVPGTGIFYLGMNVTAPGTDDVNVRKALVMAIDRKATFKALFPHIQVWDRILLPAYQCYDTTKIEAKYDPAEAKKLLAASKYAGKMPDITITYPASIEIWDRVFAAYQQQWKANLGIDVKLNSRASGVVAPPDAQIYRLSLGSPLVDAGDYLTNLSFSDGNVNRTSTHIKDAEIDAWLKEANGYRGDEKDKRCPLYNKVEARLVNDAMIWPQYLSPYYWVVKPWVKNFTGNSNQEIRGLGKLEIVGRP